MAEPTQRPRPAAKKPATKKTTPSANLARPGMVSEEISERPKDGVHETPGRAGRSGVEATAAPEAAPEPTATQLAAERGAPAPRVPHEVREAQTAVLKAQPDTDELDLSDGEITGLSIRNELRRSEGGAVTSLRVEHRDGRLLDVSAGDGVLVFRAAR